MTQLQRWGLLDTSKASHCPSNPSVRFDVGPFVLALVGDAGYHKDPYLAHGITDAFRPWRRGPPVWQQVYRCFLVKRYHWVFSDACRAQ